MPRSKPTGSPKRLLAELHRQVEADPGSIPCRQDPPTWTADDRETRELAVKACIGCPLLELCGEYADAAKEKFGVWGGRDRAARTIEPGQRYGRLVVVGEQEPWLSASGRRHWRWRCLCDCGTESLVFADSLKSGGTKSCGQHRTKGKK